MLLSPTANARWLRHVQIGQLPDSSVIARFVDFLAAPYAGEPDWHEG